MPKDDKYEKYEKDFDVNQPLSANMQFAKQLQDFISFMHKLLYKEVYDKIEEGAKYLAKNAPKSAQEAYDNFKGEAQRNLNDLKKFSNNAYDSAKDYFSKDSNGKSKDNEVEMKPMEADSSKGASADLGNDVGDLNPVDPNNTSPVPKPTPELEVVDRLKV